MKFVNLIIGGYPAKLTAILLEMGQNEAGGFYLWGSAFGNRFGTENIFRLFLKNHAPVWCANDELQPKSPKTGLQAFLLFHSISSVG